MRILPDGPEDLQDLSAVKKSGVKPKKRRRVGECAAPEEQAKIRYTGLDALPADLPHASYNNFFQNDSDNTEIERILAERAVSGKKEYKVRWVGFSSDHDEWIPEDRFTAGLNSLLLYWKEHNRLMDNQSKLSKNRREAEKPAPKYKPNRNPGVGDVVAIYPPKTTPDLIFVGKVINISDDGKKLLVHWWSSKKLDGTWSEDYLKPKKGSKARHAGPYTGSIWKEAVIDVLTDLHGLKRGKINKLKEIIKLAKEYKKKK
jgi:hypothetical protein